jgi:hypothetical protein
MELDTLYRRLEHEQGAELDGEQVKIMTPDGERFDILSVNWDDEAGEWVIVGE